MSFYRQIMKSHLISIVHRGLWAPRETLQVQPHVSVGKKGSSWAEVGVWLTEQVEKGGWTWNDEGHYQNDAGEFQKPFGLKINLTLDR
ncbi:hypothetical protein F2P79_016898 [Pimephales promelas]|nr:hypothetical protein F2P79_016898 [Pimephales promelas]